MFWRQGLNLLLDPSSTIDRGLIENEAWEPDQIAALLSYVRHCRTLPVRTRVFLDIGAYFGLYALLMDRSGEFDRIIAFEPDANNARQLAAQLFLNRTGNRIEARCEAVSDRSGIARLTRSERHPSGNRGGIGMADGPDSETQEVPMIAIDEVFDFANCAIVAKVDVEGREHAVLRGMRRTIARNRCLFQLEAFPQDREATLGAMKEVGLKTIKKIYPDIFASNIPDLCA